MASKIVIRNPFLNAITYDFFYNLPFEDVKKLSIKYRRIFASQRKIKGFCDNASLDERILFFNAIGASTGITFFFDKIKSGVGLKEVLKKYEQEKLVAAQKDHASLGIYVTTDKDTSFLMSLMGQTINHESYLKALEYNKTSYHVKALDKKLNTQKQNEILEVIDSALIVSETILNTGLSFDVCMELFGINDIELKLLILHYRQRHIYLSREDVLNKFSGYISNVRVIRGLKKLLLNGYLKQHAERQLHKSTISAQGISVVGDFMKRILKSNNF